MSSEIQAAIIGALVGGTLAYIGVAWQARRDRLRQRSAVATALLCELYVVQDLARLVRDNDNPANISAHIPTLASHQFIEHVALFDPDTVIAVMEIVRHAADLQRDLSVGGYHDPGDHRHVFRRDFADVVLGDIAAARPHLIAAGAASPSSSASHLVKPAEIRAPQTASSNER